MPPDRIAGWLNSTCWTELAVSRLFAMSKIFTKVIVHTVNDLTDH